MQEVAIVMTLDFGRDHFNAILLDNQFKLISSKGTIININDDGHRTVQEQIEQALRKVLRFFLS